MYKPPLLSELANLKQSEDPIKTINKIRKTWKEAYINRNNTCFGLNNYIQIFQVKDMTFNLFIEHLNRYYTEYLIIKLFGSFLSIAEKETNIFGHLIYKARINCRKNDRVSKNAINIIYGILSEIYDRSVDMLDEYFENCNSINVTKQIQLPEFNFQIKTIKELNKYRNKIDQLVIPYINNLDEESKIYLKDIAFKYYIWLNAITWNNGCEKYNLVLNLLAPKKVRKTH